MKTTNLNRAYLVDLKERNHFEELSDIFIIGSDDSCQGRYQDLPPRCIRIEFEKDHYVLYSLTSDTPVLVNNSIAKEVRLFECDEIRVGVHKLKFTYRSYAIPKTFKLVSKNKLWNDEISNLTNVAQTQFPVLLLGPSGTGKEILAESIHQHSSRSGGPFISVNCSALTETLIESELFGHVKGAFTGALVDRKGAFEAARGGTLFLDEIGDLPFNLQAKLLRALENNEIRPVGSDKIVKTDVRIISATHQNLTDKIQLQQFRADLYYRLNVVAVRSPALSDRMEDFDDLLAEFSKKMRVRFSPEAIDKLKRHNWPGNIRELKNTVARASAYYPGQMIEDHHVEKLVDVLVFNGQAQSPIWCERKFSRIKEVERELILKKLEQYEGNQRRASLDLGIPKSTFHDKLKFYEINPKLYKKKRYYDLKLQETERFMA